MVEEGSWKIPTAQLFASQHRIILARYAQYNFFVRIETLAAKHDYQEEVHTATTGYGVSNITWIPQPIFKAKEDPIDANANSLIQRSTLNLID
ncbi:unnamed protein product [Sphenostylis stenocarpa]|uniref:Uncharacterized protein n=1 Tax=Sphenostylis stenocarpa TaxID=92480 RepID=A0AA86TDV5_9FABA|nr:unnamed protein product [Sphenostylis stenocarpa]